MIDTKRRIQRARTRLLAYEGLDLDDSVLADHAAAMRCRDFEDWLAEGLDVLRVIRGVDDYCRELAYRGLVPDLSQLDASLQESFAWWQRIARTGLSQLEQLERDYRLDKAQVFRDAVTGVAQTLAGWHPPVASTTPGVAAWEWTEAEAMELAKLPVRPARKLQSMPAAPNDR